MLLVIKLRWGQRSLRYSGGSTGGSWGSNEPPFEPKLFYFHGEFQETLVKLHKSNPPQLIWTPDPKILDPPLHLAEERLEEIVVYSQTWLLQEVNLSDFIYCILNECWKSESLVHLPVSLRADHVAGVHNKLFWGILLMYLMNIGRYFCVNFHELLSKWRNVCLIP